LVVVERAVEEKGRNMRKLVWVRGWVEDSQETRAGR
jgi:hypothetical protein